MEPKIHASFWTDPDIEEQPPEIKLTLLWMITNPETTLCGVFRLSARRFRFHTGLDPAWLDKTLELYPGNLLRHGDRVLVKNYIRYQIGTGLSLGKNNLAKPLRSRITELPEPFRDAIYSAHPELKPLPSPPQALDNSRSDPTPAPSEHTPSRPPLGKGLPSPCQGVREGEGEGEGEGTGEGEGALRFDLAQQLLAYLNELTGSRFPESPGTLHEIARGLYRAGQDVAAVRQMLKRQVALWKNDPRMSGYLRPSTLFGDKFDEYFGQRHQPAESKNAAPPAARDDLEAALQTETDPARRKALRAQLKNTR